MTEKCEHCGATTKEFIHSLSSGLVSVLVKAITFVQKNNKNLFHYKELNLNYSEASNLQKLRLHGLIAHGDQENPKSGYWLITTRGGQFLRGEIRIPKKVKTFRNKVVGHSAETTHIDDYKNKVPYFQTKFSETVLAPSLF